MNNIDVNKDNITVIQHFVRVVGYASLNDIFTAIVNPKFAKHFEELRTHYKQGRLAEYTALKESHIAIVISGRFESGRTAESLLEYSGMMVLDFDDLGDRLQSIRQKITDDPHTLACFLSPSGDGLKGIVQVSTGADEHINSFTLLKRYYEKLTQVEIDGSGKNINRLCFLSHDPDLHKPTGQTISDSRGHEIAEATGIILRTSGYIV